MPDFNTNKVNSDYANANLPLPYLSGSKQRQDSEVHHNSGLSSWNEDKKNLVAAIALRIRQSLDLEIILNRAVNEVREFLNTDRVLIYRFEPDLSGVIVVESVEPPAQSVFGRQIKDPCFAERHLERYKSGSIHSIEDVKTAQLASCYNDVLQEFQVRANLVVPIVASEKLWGLLIAHHCQSSRRWQSSEIQLLNNLSWIDLSTWLSQIIEPFQERVENQQQKLIVKIENKSLEFKSDLSTITRILTELINNACKYTPLGESITISALSSDNEIQFCVSNTGVEIPALEQQRVFDKFYRIPHHDPWKFGGTGIGLALVKNLLELLGGTIELESQDGKTFFTIYLPCETR